MQTPLTIRPHVTSANSHWFPAPPAPIVYKHSTQKTDSEPFLLIGNFFTLPVMKKPKEPFQYPKHMFRLILVVCIVIAIIGFFKGLDGWSYFLLAALISPICSGDLSGMLAVRMIRAWKGQ